MKKEYEKPEVERMEFDYSRIITSSDTGSCFIRGMAVTWNDTGDACQSQASGDQ